MKFFFFLRADNKRLKTAIFMYYII